MWSSIPLDPSGSPLSPLPAQHARIGWYNPRTPAVHEKDLNPGLTKDEGADDERTVLELNVSAFDSTTLFLPATWAGVTHARSRPLGEDLSATKFVEIWVNDRSPNHGQTHARLHYDLGSVSEDAFWDPSAPPNGRLDTEDKNRDTKLDRSDDPSIDEDTGLDGLHDSEEPGYTGSGDPSGDDYHYITGSTDYSGINNTEKNGVDDPNARPDTEDLNLDGMLNTANDYFEATIDLADTQYVAVDVARDFAGDPDVLPDNGWRLFRIPVGAFTAFGTPTWSSVLCERMWLDGMTGPTNIQIGGIQIQPVPISELPKVLRIRSVSPNPFRDTFEIEYSLLHDGHAELNLYNLTGRLVRAIWSGWQTEGIHRVTWTQSEVVPLPSGVYFLTLETGWNTIETRRIVLLR